MTKSLRTLAALLGCLSILLAAPAARAEEGVGQTLRKWLGGSTPQTEFHRQGGSVLELEIDTADVIKAHIETLRRDAHQALADAHLPHAITAEEAGFAIALTNPADTDKALGIVKGLNQQAKVLSPSTGQISLQLAGADAEAYVASLAERSAEVLSKRAVLLYANEAWIETQKNTITLRLPGVQDATQMLSLIRQNGTLEFRLIDTSMSPDEAQKGFPPIQSELLSSLDGKETYLVQRRVLLSGADVVDAQAAFDHNTTEPIVVFRFSPDGSASFGKATIQNVNKPFAIVLDSKVLSAPVIREPITGGSGQISGNFTTQQAQNLALLLRSGALPAPLHVIAQSYAAPQP